jgi:hypothetical protein
LENKYKGENQAFKKINIEEETKSHGHMVVRLIVINYIKNAYEKRE